MTAPDEAAGAARRRSFDSKTGFVATALALGAACALFVLHPFTPTFPQASLDASWQVAMGEKAAEHARWGVDLAFTYGPASPLVTTYFNAQYFNLTVPLLTLIAVAQGLLAARLIRGRPEREGRRGATLFVTFLYALVLVGTRQNPDSFFLALPFLVFLVDVGREPGRRLDIAIAVLGAAAVGIVALAKMSFALAALPLFILADIRSVGSKRLPPLTLAFVVAFLAAYLVYGQRIGDLPAFIRFQGEVIAGYSDAMSYPGPRGEIVAFLACALALLGTALWSETRTVRSRRSLLILPLGLAYYLFIIFKAGFVRHDLHSMIAWITLGVGAFGLAAARFRAGLPRAAMPTVLAAVSLVILAVPVLTVTLGNVHPKRPALEAIYGGLFVTGPLDEARNIVAFAIDPHPFADDLDSQKQTAWDMVRQETSLPRLEGGVDIIPSAQSALIASGSAYRPRPSFQEYSTYTSGLIAANRDFLVGPSAPAWVLFGPEPALNKLAIDNRFPAFAEGGLWPDLLRAYEPTRRIGSLLALERRDVPLGPVLGPAAVQTTGFNQDVAVPPGAAFATVEVTRTALGKLAALLFRPPLLGISVRLRQGGDRSFRFVPALGAGGFVISPLITNATEFSALALGRTDDLSANEVMSFRLDASPSVQRFFAPVIQITLRPIDTRSLVPTDRSRMLAEELGPRGAWDALVKSSPMPSEDGRLLALAPKRFSLPAFGLRHLSVGFGLYDDAWGSGRSEGVCFAIRRGDSAGPPLWGRCLDPLHVERDRGEQSTEVDVPDGSSEIMLETTCRASCDWGWSYWDGFEPR